MTKIASKTDPAFVALWHAKIAAEREMAHLIAQGREAEADRAWERVLEACAEIRHHRV